jgi:hypothetical protein
MDRRHLRGQIASFADIAKREAQSERHFRLLAPLAFVSPRIIAAIVDSTAPAGRRMNSRRHILAYHHRSMLIPPKNEAKMIMPAKMFSAMGVWTSLEPLLSAPTPSPSPQGRGEPTEFAALYRIEFWKMDLGAFTGRGQGGPCLTDAAQ